MSVFIVNPEANKEDIWIEIDFTRGCISSGLGCMINAEGTDGDELLQAFGTLHMVMRSFDQLQDLIEKVKPLKAQQSQ